MSAKHAEIIKKVPACGCPQAGFGKSGNPKNPRSRPLQHHNCHTSRQPDTSILHKLSLCPSSSQSS